MIGHVGADHDELVPAESGHRVVGTDDLVEAAGEHLEQLVSGGVAMGVVDVLEAIEVEEQHRGGGSLPLADGQVLGESVLQEGTVG